MPYKIIATVIALIAILGIGYVEGKSRCEVKEVKADTTAQGKAQLGVTKVEDTYGPKITTLEEAAGGAGAVGPLTTRALDGLR